MSKILIGDGGMGTELRMRGVEVPSHVESIWSALALTENTSIIKEIHQDYIKAGAEFIICLLYTSPSPRDGLLSRMPSSA